MSSTNICFANVERFPDADKNRLIKKFNSLRTNFRKELKRIKDSLKSDTVADDVVEATLWYSEEMKFLIGQEEPCTSLNNNNNIYLTAIGSSPGGSGFCHVYKKT
jgi:hypothetical protein